MINKIDETIIAQLHDYLEDIQYGLIWQNIMSANDVKAYECIADYELMKRLLSFVTDNKMRVIYKLFLLGYKVPRKLLQNILSETLLDQLIDIGFLIRDNEYFFTDNYMILYIKGYYLVVDIPFYFPSCEKKNTDTYLGWDSFLLLDNHTTKRAEKVLDLCSGSGIQSIVASEHSKKTIAIEINPRAVWVSKFNVVLNSLTDLIECRNGDLYDSIAENETFDVIYANPPFLPVEESLPFSIIGHGGANGLKITKKILEGLDKHLKDDGEPLMLSGRARKYVHELLPSHEQYIDLLKKIDFLNVVYSNTMNISWGDPLDHIFRFKSGQNDITTYASIKANGDIPISPYLPLSVGNVRKHSFLDYWRAGLPIVWRLDIAKKLADNLMCMTDMARHVEEVPDTWWEEDIKIDIIDDHLLY